MAPYQEIHREIIELSKAGNPKAQQQLYILYAKAMYNICYRMMNHREEAEDMLQEAFTEAFLKLGTFRFESAFGAWLKKITVNKCINALKQKRVSLVHQENLPEAKADDADNDIPSINADSILQAMQELPEGYRVVFSLYLLEGYDHTEISEILGITESTSKSQYSRARQRMKEILKNQTNEG